jgi:phosphoribosylaminoimidazolecarboxamide formyltransferase/IMP cyclohydrolase
MEGSGRQGDNNLGKRSEICQSYLQASKSNAIALIKNKQLIGKRLRANKVVLIRCVNQLKRQSNLIFDLHGAVLASDAFFPFNDCVKMSLRDKAFLAGGSIRDKDSIDYCVENKLAMVMTGMRHFKH